MRTKFQYKDFEPGEFTNEKDRTLGETIDLISSFPWQDQHDHLITMGNMFYIISTRNIISIPARSTRRRIPSR